MTTLSLDYQAVLASLDHPLDAAEVGAALLSALGDRYALEHEESALHEFEQSVRPTCLTSRVLLIYRRRIERSLHGR